MPNIFQNDFGSTREAAPPEEPEPELFFEESELYQTALIGVLAVITTCANEISLK